MTYYGGKDMAASFRTVRNNTILAAKDIPEDKYTYQATPDTSSVAERLVHMALSTGLQEMIHKEERLTFTLRVLRLPFPLRRHLGRTKEAPH